MLRIILSTLMLLGAPVYAEYERPKPLIVIGASFENGKIPFNEGLNSPLFGACINQCSYLDTGAALVKRSRYVVNEAQAGATTFERVGCGTGPTCNTGVWNGFDTQLMRGFSRVFNPVTGQPNADYVVVGTPNDCLHSDAFGVPQGSATPCNSTDFQDVAARMVAVGNQALALGLTPVFSEMPEYESFDFAFAQAAFFWAFTIDEASYNQLKNTVDTALANAPGFIFVENAWKNFRLLKRADGSLVDGIHPDRRTVKLHTHRLLSAIHQFEGN